MSQQAELPSREPTQPDVSRWPRKRVLAAAATLVGVSILAYALLAALSAGPACGPDPLVCATGWGL